MHTGIYLHLALQSLKKNYRISLPFFGGSTLMCMMFYSIASMAYNPSLGDIYGGSMMNDVMSFGEKIMMLFVLIFFFYLNSVWYKNRRQENGLFTILGMEKQHLIRILFYQLAIMLIASLGCGILLGICLDKIMFMLILRISGMEPEFGFYISQQGITDTVLWVGLCYVLIFGWSAFMMLKSNPLEQLHGKQVGEKKIKNRWILAVLGLVSLGGGYAISLMVKDPLSAILLFFVAVILVIIGTYLLFMFGSTVLVQILQNNKTYYYKPSHFISVSTMKYRLKQNAAALANIAILSTMVLVTLSTTTSLIAGVDDVVNSQQPLAYQSQLLPFTDENGESHRTGGASLMTAQGEKNIDELSQDVQNALGSIGIEPKDLTLIPARNVNFQSSSQPGNGIVYGTVIDLQTLNALGGKTYSAAPGEVISLSQRVQPGTVLTDQNDGGQSYTVKETIESLPAKLTPYREIAAANNAAFAANLNDGLGTDIVLVEFDADTASDRSQDIQNALEAQGLSTMRTQYKPALKQEFLSTYSGVLFIGIYLSALFVLAVILIMYYKQISEGLEDQGRFQIMKNVGLEARQIRQIINDQVLLMFFLPLGAALLHLCFAYPIIEKIMTLLTMGNSQVFLLVTAICFAIFALIYVIIYRLTARTYFRLTWQPDKKSS